MGLALCGILLALLFLQDSLDTSFVCFKDATTSAIVYYSMKSNESAALDKNAASINSER